MSRGKPWIVFAAVALVICADSARAGNRFSGAGRAMARRMAQDQLKQQTAEQKAIDEAEQKAAAAEAAEERRKREMHTKASRARHEREAQARQAIIAKRKVEASAKDEAELRSGVGKNNESK